MGLVQMGVEVELDTSKFDKKVKILEEKKIKLKFDKKDLDKQIEDYNKSIKNRKLTSAINLSNPVRALVAKDKRVDNTKEGTAENAKAIQDLLTTLQNFNDTMERINDFAKVLVEKGHATDIDKALKDIGVMQSLNSDDFSKFFVGKKAKYRVRDDETEDIIENIYKGILKNNQQQSGKLKGSTDLFRKYNIDTNKAEEEVKKIGGIKKTDLSILKEYESLKTLLDVIINKKEELLKQDLNDEKVIKGILQTETDLAHAKYLISQKADTNKLQALVSDKKIVEPEYKGLTEQDVYRATNEVKEKYLAPYYRKKYSADFEQGKRDAIKEFSDFYSQGLQAKQQQAYNMQGIDDIIRKIQGINDIAELEGKLVEMNNKLAGADIITDENKKDFQEFLGYLQRYRSLGEEITNLQLSDNVKGFLGKLEKGEINEKYISDFVNIRNAVASQEVIDAVRPVGTGTGTGNGSGDGNPGLEKEAEQVAKLKKELAELQKIKLDFDKTQAEKNINDLIKEIDLLEQKAEKAETQKEGQIIYEKMDSKIELLNKAILEYKSITGSDKFKDIFIENFMDETTKYEGIVSVDQKIKSIKEQLSTYSTETGSIGGLSEEQIEQVISALDRLEKKLEEIRKLTAGENESGFIKDLSTMVSEITELKEKMNFDTLIQSLDNLNSAISNIDFSSLTQKAKDAAQDMQNEFDNTKIVITETLKENILQAITGMKKPMFHVGNLSSNVLNNSSFQIPDGLALKGKEASLGSGLYWTSNLEDALLTLSQNQKQRRGEKLYIKDFSDVSNLKTITSEEEYDKYIDTLSSINKFIMKVAGLLTDDKNKIPTDVNELYEKYKQFFDNLHITQEVLLNYIEQEKKYVIDNKSNSLADNLNSRFQSYFMGVKGVDTTQVAELDNYDVGSVLFNVDTSGIYEYVNGQLQQLVEMAIQQSIDSLGTFTTVAQTPKPSNQIPVSSSNKSNISSENIAPIEEKIQDVGNGTKRIISEIGMSYDDFIKKVKSDNSLEERFAVFDRYGKVIESLKGDINSLVLPDNLNTSGAAKIVHTHPSMNALGGTLSEDDYLQWYSKFLSKGIGEQFELLWRGKSLNIDLSNVREELRSSVIAALVNISHVAGLQLEKSDGEIPLPLSDIYNSLSNGLLKNSVEKSGGTVSTEILDETKNKVQNIEALISILDDFGNFRRINLGNDDAIVERIEQYKSVLKFLSEHEEYTYDQVQKILANERMTIIGTNSQGLTHNGMQLKNDTAEWMSEYLADSYSRINNLSVNSSNFDPFNMSSDAEKSYADITCKYYDAIAEAMDYVVRDALEGKVSENDFVSSAMSSIAGEIGSLDDDEMLKAFLESKERVQEYIQNRFDVLKTSMDASPMIEVKKDEQSVEEQSKETANAIDEMIAKFSSTEIENMAKALTQCLRGLADFDEMAKSLGVTVDDLYTARDIFNNKDLFNSLSQNPIKDVFQGNKNGILSDSTTSSSPSKLGVTKNAPIVETDNSQEITREQQALTSLGEYIGQVIKLVNEKTAAFEKEQQVVDGSIQREITALTELSGWLVSVKEDVDKITTAIANLPSIDIKADLSGLDPDKLTEDVVKKFSELSKALNNTDTSNISAEGISALNGLDVSKTAGDNLQKVANAITNIKVSLNNLGDGGKSFIEDIKEIVNAGEALKNFNEILKKSKTEREQIVEEVKGVKSESKTPTIDTNNLVGTAKANSEIISKEMERAIQGISVNNVEKVPIELSNEFEKAANQIILDMQKVQGEITKVDFSTSSVYSGSATLLDDDKIEADIEGVQKLTGAVVTYKNELGEVITTNYTLQKQKVPLFDSEGNPVTEKTKDGLEKQVYTQIEFFGQQQEKLSRKTVDAEKNKAAAIENTNVKLDKQLEVIKNIQATYDQKIAPGLTKFVPSDSKDYTSLQTKHGDIETYISSLKGTEATKEEMSNLSTMISEYRRLAKIKVQANNITKKEMGGQEFEVAVSGLIAKYEILIDKASKYGDTTKDIVKNLRKNLRALSKKDENGKRIISTDDFYDKQAAYKIDNDSFKVKMLDIAKEEKAEKDRLDRINNMYSIMIKNLKEINALKKKRPNMDEESKTTTDKRIKQLDEQYRWRKKYIGKLDNGTKVSFDKEERELKRLEYERSVINSSNKAKRNKKAQESIESFSKIEQKDYYDALMKSVDNYLNCLEKEKTSVGELKEHYADLRKKAKEDIRSSREDMQANNIATDVNKEADIIGKFSNTRENIRVANIKARESQKAQYDKEAQDYEKAYSDAIQKVKDKRMKAFEEMARKEKAEAEKNAQYDYKYRQDKSYKDINALWDRYETVTKRMEGGKSVDFKKDFEEASSLLSQIETKMEEIGKSGLYDATKDDAVLRRWQKLESTVEDLRAKVISDAYAMNADYDKKKAASSTKDNRKEIIAQYNKLISLEKELTTLRTRQQAGIGSQYDIDKTEQEIARRKEIIENLKQTTSYTQKETDAQTEYNNKVKELQELFNTNSKALGNSQVTDFINRLGNINVLGLEQNIQDTYTQIGKLTDKFSEGKITVTDYQKQVGNLVIALENVKKVIEPNNINLGKSELEQYFAENGAQVKKVSTSKDGKTLTVDATKYDGVNKSLKELVGTYDLVTGRVSVFERKTSSAMTNLQKSLAAFKGKLQAVFRYLTTFVGVYEIIGAIKSGISTVIEFDTALSEMRKVSSASTATLKELQKESFNVADEVGSTALQIQKSTADFLRLGKSQQKLWLAPLYRNV